MPRFVGPTRRCSPSAGWGRQRHRVTRCLRRSLRIPFREFCKDVSRRERDAFPPPCSSQALASLGLGEVSGCAPTRQRHRVTRCLRGSLRLDAPPPMPWLRSPGQGRLPGLRRKPLRARCTTQMTLAAIPSPDPNDPRPTISPNIPPLPSQPHVEITRQQEKLN